MNELDMLRKQLVAAMDDLNGICWCCKNGRPSNIGTWHLIACDHMRERGIIADTGKKKCPYWEWRGIVEGEQNGTTDA